MSEQNQLSSASAQVYARIAGALYLVIIVIGVLGEAVIRGRLVVGANAAATAERILQSEFLWRLGVAGQLVLLVCAIALTFIWSGGAFSRHFAPFVFWRKCILPMAFVQGCERRGMGKPDDAKPREG